MNTIFDEKKYCEDLLSNKPKYVKSRYLYMLLAYYKYLGYDVDDDLKLLELFCSECDPHYNTTIHIPLFNNLRKNYNTCTLRVPKIIGITQKELDIIKSIRDYKKEKFLFICLVLAKNSYKNTDKYYANDIKESTLFSLAKINITKKDRNKLLYELEQSKLITQFANKYNNKIQKNITVNFVDNSIDYILTILDMDNIISYYPNYFYCEKCGDQQIIDLSTSRRKICDKCYEEKRNRDNLEIKRNNGWY
jgi:hypothetical protein